MTSKRDVQLVRLACKWRWLTAEEGEDCLALSHRLGATVAMEEIIRRRGYLDADAPVLLLDAETGEPVARESLLRSASGTLRFSSCERYQRCSSS